MAENRKVQLEFEVSADASPLEQLAAAAQAMGERLQAAGQQGTQGLNAIGQAAEPAAQKLEQAERRMQAAVERRLAAMRAGAQGTAEYFEAISRARNVNTAPFDAQIAELRALEQAQKAAQKAAVEASRADAFIASLQQQAQAAGRTRSEILALQAAELGLADKVAPYIARLREAEQGQTQLGMSARATAAALRGVPAQFTDIVTAIQGGQRPITVLMQQGGQLKDMFGGIGPAARALGGYMVGLVNPFTIAAAAVAVLGVELAHAESQLRSLNSVQALLAGTGRSGLFSTTDIKAFIAELSKAPGVTRDVATQIVTELAKAHEIGGDLFRDLGKLAADYARATGTDIPAAARALAKAFSDPAKGAKELEASLGTLTSAQILSIERLTRMGDVAGAQRVLLDALNTSIKGLADTSLTALQRATNDVGNAWERLGQRMEQSQGLRTINELLAKAVGSVAWLIDHADKVPTWALLMVPGAGLPLALSRGGEPTFRGGGATGSFGSPASAGTTGAAAGDDEVKRALEAANAYRSQAGQMADLTEKRTGFNKALQDSIRLYGQDSEQSKRLRDAIAAIGEQIARTQNQGASEAAGLRAKRLELQQEIAQLLADQDRLLAGDTRSDKQTDAAKQVLKLQEELRSSLTGVARAAKERALAEAQANVAVEQQRDQIKRVNDELKAGVDTRTKNIEAINQQASTIREAAVAQEAANATTGKSKTAIEEETLAKYKAAAADQVLADLDPQRRAAMLQRIADQERYVDALKAGEAHQINQRLDEAARANTEDAQTLQLEISLMGRSREERDKILAQRRIEVDLAKELASIDHSSSNDKDAERARARANAAQRAETAASRATLDEWQRTADSINSSLTDAGVDAFHHIRDAGSIARKDLESLFDSLILRPTLQAVMAPVSGALAGITQGIGGSIVGGGGSALGGLGGLAGGIGSLFGAGGMAGSLAAGAGWLTGSTTLMGSLGAAGSLIGTGTGAGILSGLGMGLGALGPIGLGALAAYAIFGGKGGGPKTESGFGQGVPLRGDQSSAKVIADGIAAQYGAIAGEFAKNLQLGVFTATDPQGTAQTQLAVNARLNGQDIYSRGARLGGIENVGRSQEELAAAITEESNRVILEALAATGLPDKIGDYLRQLGDIDALSGGSLEAAVQKLQKAMTERQTLDARMFELTHTAEEQVIETRRKERAALDDTNQALYDHVARLEDLTAAATAAAQAVDTARGSLTDAYQREVERVQATAQAVTQAQSAVQTAYRSEADTLQQLATRHRDFATQLRADAAALNQAVPQSRAQRLAAANRGFAATSAQAFAGDETALQGLGASGSELIDAVRQAARTPQEVVAAIARVQAGLITAAASSEGRATAADLQLDQLTAQVSALGVLNDSVLTVSQAIDQLVSAQGDNAQAQAQLDAMTQQLSALGVLNTTVLSVGQALAAYLEALNRQAAAQNAIQQAQLNYTAAMATAQGVPPPTPVAVSTSGAVVPVMGDLQQLQHQQAVDFTIQSILSANSFAVGGLARGVSFVGERGRELVDFETPGRVYTHEQTKGMFASNAELVPLLREMVAELRSAREDGRVVDVATVNTLQKIDGRLKKFEIVGMPPERAPV
jgi:hypothetical protein